MTGNPFNTFTVFPSYGIGQANISWSLVSGVTGDLYFYRSESGLPNTWTLLNADVPQTGTSGEFLDTTPALNMLTPVFYRGMVDGGGPPETWLKGEMVTALDSMPRREYFLTREVLRREYQFMVGHEGLQILHFVPKEKGEAATNADLETRQLTGPACAGDPAAGYTTLWAGGFYPPVQSWAMISQMGDFDHKVRPDATGETPEATIALRLLAFPRPARGHILVFRRSDRRYVIQDPIKPFYLRGSSPLVWECQALMLNRDDPRYSLPCALPDADPVSA